MKHWKQIFVTDIKARVATWDRCTITMEDGSSKDILLAHCDPEVRNPISALSQSEARLDQLKAAIGADTDQLSGPSQQSAIAVQRMHASISIDRAALQRQLGTEESNHDRVLLGKAQEARRIALLAMFTGQMYSGLQVWDCGEKR